MSTRLMKTTVRRALAALFGSAGVLLLLAAGVQGSGTASSDEQVAATHCGNATIRGTYGGNIQGTRPVPPPLGGGTETVIGVVLRTYDGAGNFTQIDNVKGSVTGIEPDRWRRHVSGKLELYGRHSCGARTRDHDRGANGDHGRRRGDTLHHRQSPRRDGDGLSPRELADNRCCRRINHGSHRAVSPRQ